jgi:predicted TIM-barrel fold metal-dependent hydrolase
MSEQNRRAVLGGLSAMAAMPIADAKAQTPGPKFAIPDGACDTHFHIFDPRFPYMPDAALKPPFATASQYRMVMQRMRLSRGVVVCPTTYGTDNRATIDAMAFLGPNMRGVAGVNPDVSDADIKRWHELGVRGIRLDTGVGLSDIPVLARRIAPYGWHVQSVLSTANTADMGPVLLSLPTPVVLVHMGRVPQPAGMNSPAYKTVRQLLDKNGYVKLSNPYVDSKLGPPAYADMGAIAKSYVAARPDKILWGSNWPLPDMTTGPLPDVMIFLNLLADWAPDEAIRHRILVENPEAVYGFDAKARPKAA